MSNENNEKAQNGLLTPETFAISAQIAGIPNNNDLNFLFNVYQAVIVNVLRIINANQSLAHSINPVSIASYIYNEFSYTTSSDKEELKVKKMQDPIYIQGIVSVVVDKYFSLEYLKYNVPITNNKFFPPVSTLDLHVNQILNILNRYKLGNPNQTLILDMLNKAFSMCHCILYLLSNGYETEAFSTWRTLHETECNLIILNNYPESIPTYIRHITYNLAFRNAILDTEEQDKIFIELKERMHERDYKSKDMKRYIENGWIFAIDKFAKDPEVKINFRNGIEYAAGLSELNEWYEMSSEFAHSSPMLIYSDKSFFFNIALIATYESFLRIETIFNNAITNYGFEENVIKEYSSMRTLHLEQLKQILKNEKEIFEKISEKYSIKRENENE